MYITRNSKNIELTADELFQAYLEQQQLFRKDAFQGELSEKQLICENEELYRLAFSIYVHYIEKDYSHTLAFAEAEKIIKGGLNHE